MKLARDPQMRQCGYSVAPEGLVSVLFANVAMVECVDAVALETALQGGLESFVVWRISDRAVVVDHERLDDVLKLLRRQGQTPKVTLD